MARPASKRHGPRAVRRQSPKPTSNEPPTPFTLASPKLAPLLETLPEDGFYLTHIDRCSRVEKRQLFLAPLLLNFVFVLVIAARLYFAVPQYVSLLRAFFGYDSDARVDTTTMPFAEQMRTLMSRAGLLILDYALFSLMGRWIWRFIQEEITWRWCIGLREEEVVVRVSKRWHTDLEERWTAANVKTIQAKTLPELENQRIQKSSLQLVTPLFALDTEAMINAQELVDRGELSLDDLDRKVFFKYKPAKGWIVWSLSEPKSISSTIQSTNLSALRENLVAKDREDLFFRYVEIVQYEASESTGFSISQQKKAWTELSNAFAEKRVDLAKVRAELGGQSKMAFFEDTVEDFQS